MSKNDRYQNYPPEVVLKRVVKYAWKSRVLIGLSLLFLTIFTVLELFQPRLVSKLLDDYLLSVQTTWEKAGNEVLFENEYYQKKTENSDPNKLYTIVYYESEYILVDTEIEKENIDSIEKTDLENHVIVNVSDTKLNGRILNKEELRCFFNPVIPLIIKVIIIYAILTIIITVLRFFQNIFFENASMRLTLDMRRSAFDKLNRLPMNYFVQEPSGKIVTKIISDSEGVRGLYSVIFQIIAAVISLIMVLVALFMAEWKLALICICVAPIILVWMTVYRKVNNKYNHRIREMNSIINANMAQYVGGMEIIQQFEKEEQMHDEYDELLKTNYKNKMNSLKINSIFGSELLGLIRNGLTALVIFYFGRNILTGSSVISAGLLYLYVTYIERIVDPIMMIFFNLNALEDSFVASARIFDLLDQPEDLYLGFNEKPNFQGNVEFKNITFSYDGVNPVLKDISFSVKSGEFIGLAGHTGSGKTTIMTLLQRFYDLQEGQIIIDGVDFMEYTKQEVRSNIGYVIQEPAIFSGTIKSNITMNEEFSDEEVEKVLMMIGAEKFVNGFTKGIHTELDHLGSNLSTGEKQLLSFARILLRDPKIIILDEATANIDTQTESIIQKALAVLAKGRTTFVVAHRLSTIQHADQIYVLNAGEVAEHGTHEELYNANGHYRSMYDAQFQK